MASLKILGQWETHDLEENLMDFLRRHGIPVASSCGGDGVCRRCVVNGELLSCQMNVGGFLALVPNGIVRLSYL